MWFQLKHASLKAAYRIAAKTMKGIMHLHTHRLLYLHLVLSLLLLLGDCSQLLLTVVLEVLQHSGLVWMCRCISIVSTQTTAAKH